MKFLKNWLLRRQNQKSNQAGACFNDAQRLTNEGNFAEAEKMYEKAKRLGFASPVLEHYHGCLLDRMNEPLPKVLEHWAKAVSQDFPGVLGTFSDIVMRLVFRGDRPEANRWTSRAAEAYQRSQAEGKTRYILEDYTSVIGHLCNLDFYIKAIKLGWKNGISPTQIVRSKNCVNNVLLDYWGQYLEVIAEDDPRLPSQEERQSLQEPMGFNVLKAGAYHFWETWHLVQAEWEKHGREPLLQISESHRSAGAGILRKNFPEAEKKWFVCIHAREEGFHRDQKGLYQTTRNADIETYRQAIDLIHDAGGQVIRVGDASMRDFSMPGVWDYARSSAKSPMMDIFLCGSCRFYLGSASGLCHVPPLFGVPVALTNWVPMGVRSSYGADRFIPKTYIWRDSGRIFNLREMMDPPYHHWQFPGFFEKAGVDIIDNTPEQIADLACEMLSEPRGLSPEQEAFESLSRKEPICYGKSPIGRTFIQKNANLLI